MGEFETIAAHLAPATEGAPGALGLADDAALLSPAPGHELVITTDALVEGRHFIGDEGPDDLARKLMRVNLSDLAAMGAAPLAYFLTLALQARRDEVWVAKFARGLRGDQDRFGGRLMGGDTVSIEGPLVLSLTAIGQVPAGGALRRSGARPGEALFVTGALGDAALGLAVLRDPALNQGDDALAHLIARYRRPEPRLGMGQGLRGLAGAAMDISDGLVGDLDHMAKASGVAIQIEAAALPLSDAASIRIAEAPERFAAALSGGDDYELAFTAAPERTDDLKALSEAQGVTVTRIGAVTSGAGVNVLDRNGAPIALAERGYRHF